MDGECFDALVSAWTTSRFGRRAGLRTLAGIAFGAGLAGFNLTEANNKKKGKGKKKKKNPPKCREFRKRCGGQCIAFHSCCDNGKVGCPPCYLCGTANPLGPTCQTKEFPDCEPCQEHACKDDAFECVDKPKPDCTGCQQAVCKDGSFQCADSEGVTPCGPNPDLCCYAEENHACCQIPPQLGIPGNMACVPREEECGNQDCRTRCPGAAVCCDTLQKCCPGPNDTTICKLFGESCLS